MDCIAFPIQGYAKSDATTAALQQQGVLKVNGGLNAI